MYGPMSSKIAPQYVDLQVNGYAGVDFNSDGLTAEMLHGACQRLRSDGVAGILATIITAAPENMLARLREFGRVAIAGFVRSGIDLGHSH